MSKTDRPLKKGWRRGLIRSVCDSRGETTFLPIIFQDLSLVPSGRHADKEWFPAHAAPDRAFEPAEHGALKVGERVYVDCPKVPYVRKVSIRGWGKIFPGEVADSNNCRALLDSDCWRDRGWIVLRAALHPEGPQSEPPHEGAVFLGRYWIGGKQLDGWWFSCGGVAGVGIGLSHTVWTPQQIDADDHTELLRPGYRDALARARALGLVEAEPERAEPTEAAMRAADACIREASCNESLSLRSRQDWARKMAAIIDRELCPVKKADA